MSCINLFKVQKGLKQLYYTFVKSGYIAIIFRRIKLKKNYENNNNQKNNVIDLGNLPNWKWLLKVNFIRIISSPSIIPNIFLRLSYISLKNFLVFYHLNDLSTKIKCLNLLTW